MGNFKNGGSGWTRFAPASLQAALCLPTPVNKTTRGRVELCIGRLGAGKTTWGAMRAVRLANATGRQIATTGIGWDAPWIPVQSFDDLEALRETVLIWDEIHLMLPSTRGMLRRDDERDLVRWLSLCRKRGVCVVATTQAWTRVATHFRQLVTTVWLCEPHRPGVLHHATPHDTPDSGGEQILPRQWYDPRNAAIPTRAEVWTGAERHAGGVPSAPASQTGVGRGW